MRESQTYSLGFFFGPGFPRGLGVFSPKAPEFLLVPRGAAGFFLIASVGGSMAVEALGAMGTGVDSAFVSLGAGDEAFTMGGVSIEEVDGFDIISAFIDGGLSFRRKSDDVLSLIMSVGFGGGFLDLLLGAGVTGAVVEG